MTRIESSSPAALPHETEGLIDELTHSLRDTAREVVPWFLSQMPQVYFQDTDAATQMAHLRAIIACRASGRPLELTLRNDDATQWTLMRPRDYPGVLAEVVAELPTDRALLAAKIHTAMDGRLVLDTFEFGERRRFFNRDDPPQAAKLQRTIGLAAAHHPNWTAQAIARHFRGCTEDYVLNVTPYRISRQRALIEQINGTEGTAVELEAESDPRFSRISLAAGNSTTRTMLERIAARLSRHSINIHRAHLDVIDLDDHNAVTLLGFVVQGPDGGPLDEASELWRSVQRDLLRTKWLDQAAINLDQRHARLSLTQAEVLVALCHLAHQALVKVNPFAFDRNRIIKLAERNLAQAIQIVDLFLERFDPTGPLDDAAMTAQSGALRHEINREVDLEDARTVLHKLLEAVQATLRTNVFLERRYALSLRIDPAYLTSNEREEAPFGAFFVHGRSFDGFHVRFRDIARGGLRVVRTGGPDQHARESERLYDEVYGLALAQQLKNKDIPEGGAKAIVLLAPDALLHRSVKAFVDAVIDLITPAPDTRRDIVDHFGQDELLYLGPDENITPDLIDWIVARARQRGYGTPNALMSSKPGAGINHKVYGVTSEGVTVFLDAALRAVGIDPRARPFTVKLTGGPDGDVAGNEIRILDREYGGHARIVGIADGSGSAEDPDGLRHDELLRLVADSRPIAEFDRAKLGPRGQLVTLDEAHGVSRRNTMHNRVLADAFIPAGGRPNAVHAGNWRDYLTADGSPSSLVIVEGANLFLTAEARRELSDRGTLIIKDSSANKCGVICSSYEICASMLLSESEFLGIKEKFVEQVLVKLRELARREADLLMRIHRHHPQVPLPEMSTRLSRVIIRAADAIFRAIDSLTPEDQKLLRQLVIDHLPPVLVQVAGERLWAQTPPAYLKSIMSKSLAARIVYREGFEYLESMPAGAIADLAVRYLRTEQETFRLAEQLRQSSLPDKDRIAALLVEGGMLPRIRDN